LGGEARADDGLGVMGNGCGNQTEGCAFGQYFRELGIHLGRIQKDAAPRVWRLWYSLYRANDEMILYKIFDQLGDLPFDVQQVDDGWQTESKPNYFEQRRNLSPRLA
jgi:alpha-galactosidase